MGGYHKSHGQVMDGSGAFTLLRPGTWVTAGLEEDAEAEAGASGEGTRSRLKPWPLALAGLAKGSEFGGTGGGVVGYECDGCRTDRATLAPTGEDGTPTDFVIVVCAGEGSGLCARALFLSFCPDPRTAS